jgi:hypothetical protein
MALEWTNLKKTPAGATNTSGSRTIERIKLGDGENRIRLIGNVMPRYVYWLTNNEGKRTPVECLSFDRETETFTDREGVDPVKEIDSSIYSEKPTFSYVCNAIDRKDGQIKLFDLKPTVYKQILDYAINPEYGNPAADEEGYDITIKREKTGPQIMNVKYTCIPSRRTVAITDEEKALELYELEKIFKRPSYEDQKDFILRNTSYFSDSVASDLRVDDNETMEDV